MPPSLFNPRKKAIVVLFGHGNRGCDYWAGKINLSFDFRASPIWIQMHVVEGHPAKMLLLIFVNSFDFKPYHVEKVTIDLISQHMGYFQCV